MPCLDIVYLTSEGVEVILIVIFFHFRRFSSTFFLKQQKLEKIIVKITSTPSHVNLTSETILDNVQARHEDRTPSKV